eukprot:TRINITY_DN3313_c0_g1_i1.p2 TRINITY_DN3313_c0_g1~~TRINITY_DN3313_c0_g1_i1.p2  ORF type:complete len:258 (-),score=50.34 TRINITY_DN3313_c0_g1_i1:45-818(-)
MSRNGKRPVTQLHGTYLQSMHHKESLTHNAARAYREDAARPPPGEYISLTHVEQVHGKKKVDLSTSDPSPGNVRRIHEAAARTRSSGKVEPPPIAEPNFYDEPSSTFVTEVRTLPELPRLEGKRESMIGLSAAANSAPAVPPVPQKRKPLPAVVADHPDYSSTMALLQLTRKDVEGHARDISAINSILTLPGSIELKRTIAKMFADPKHAEEISRMEWERREKKYEEERNRQLQKQAEQLKKEREILQQELDNLKMA